MRGARGSIELGEMSRHELNDRTPLINNNHSSAPDIVIHAPESDKASDKVSDKEKSNYGSIDDKNNATVESGKTVDISDLYFRDGERKIDIVLAYQPDAVADPDKRYLYERYRHIFLKKMRRYGLKLEEEGVEESQDGKTCFIKIHAPFSTLAAIAELNNLRLPIAKDENVPEPNIVEKWLDKKFGLPEDFKVEDPIFYRAVFRRNRLRQFLFKDRDKMFPGFLRIRLVWEIMEKIQVLPDDLSKRRLQPLVQHPADVNWMKVQGIFKAVYPLHEGDLKYHDVAPKNLPLRDWLRAAWASQKKIFKYQPLGRIRFYFGEQITLYFAWLGYYTEALILPMIFGFITFLIGCFAVATPAFAFFMALWSSMFLERWKRQQSSLAFKWDTWDMGAEQGEPIRPEYYRFATDMEKNPVTDQMEPSVPQRRKTQRLAQSIISLITMIIIVIAVIISILVYKMVSGAVYQRQGVSWWIFTPSLIASITGSIISTICILIMEKLYTKIAWILTEREFPRSESEFEASYTYKMFTFQFVNFYATLFYYAFFSGKFAENPLDHSYFNRRCAPGSCYEQLCLQFITLLVVKQAISNFMEIFMPKLMNWIRRRKNVAATEENPYSQWEKDFDLADPPRLSLNPEYFEMVLQYGLVTMFAAAFPLAPFLAWFNNIFEIRIDSFKFLGEYRRVIPRRARDIGVYTDILSFLSTAAVLVNGGLIAFSTSFVDRAYYQYHHGSSLDGFWDMMLSKFHPKDWNIPALAESPWGNVTTCYYLDIREDHFPYNHRPIWWHIMLIKVSFVLIFQNVIFLFQKLIDYFIPDVPEEIQIRMQREVFMARQNMYNQEFPAATKDEPGGGGGDDGSTAATTPAGTLSRRPKSTVSDASSALGTERPETAASDRSILI